MGRDERGREGERDEEKEGGREGVGMEEEGEGERGLGMGDRNGAVLHSIHGRKE